MLIILVALAQSLSLSLSVALVGVDIGAFLLSRLPVPLLAHVSPLDVEIASPHRPNHSKSRGSLRGPSNRTQSALTGAATVSNRALSRASEAASSPSTFDSPLASPINPQLRDKLQTRSGADAAVDRRSGERSDRMNEGDHGNDGALEDSVVVDVEPIVHRGVTYLLSRANDDVYVLHVCIRNVCQLSIVTTSSIS